MLKSVFRRSDSFRLVRTKPPTKNKSNQLSYGLGWGLYWTPHGKAFFKEGHDDGWRNYTVVFDTPKSGFVIMTNSGNGEGFQTPDDFGGCALNPAFRTQVDS